MNVSNYLAIAVAVGGISSYLLWKTIRFRSDWISQGTCLHQLQSSVSQLQSSVSQLQLQGCNVENERLRYVPLAVRNPYRQQLANTVLPQLQSARTKLEPVLFPGTFELGDLDHMYKLKTRDFPYSLTDEEGLILYALIKENGLVSAYEIATAFGYSTLFIALAIRATGGTLVTLDAYIEEEKQDFNYAYEDVRRHTAALRERLSHGDNGWPVGYRFAEESLIDLHLRDLVRLEVGISPDEVSQVLGDRPLDFALIDGGHHHAQPSQDLLAIVDRLDGDKFAVFFHDAMVPDVAEAVWLCCDKMPGSSIMTFNTRNCLTLVSRGLDEQSLRSCAAVVARTPKVY